MTRRARPGQDEWRARAGGYPAELGEQTRAGADDRMERWAARGRVPLMARLCARLRGQPIVLPEQETAGADAAAGHGPSQR